MAEMSDENTTDLELKPFLRYTVFQFGIIVSSS